MARLSHYITKEGLTEMSSSFPLLSHSDNMPRSTRPSSSSHPARTPIGNLPEGVEYNIFGFRSAPNSSHPYPSAEDWYRCSDTDVPNEMFEDLGNVIVKL